VAYCIKCGIAAHPGAAFCHACGKPMPATPPLTGASLAPASLPPPSRQAANAHDGQVDPATQAPFPFGLAVVCFLLGVFYPLCYLYAIAGALDGRDYRSIPPEESWALVVVAAFAIWSAFGGLGMAVRQARAKQWAVNQLRAALLVLVAGGAYMAYVRPTRGADAIRLSLSACILFGLPLLYVTKSQGAERVFAGSPSLRMVKRAPASVSTDHAEEPKTTEFSIKDKKVLGRVLLLLALGGFAMIAADKSLAPEFIVGGMIGVLIVLGAGMLFLI
jgi:hypothetical protein